MEVRCGEIIVIHTYLGPLSCRALNGVKADSYRSAGLLSLSGLAHLWKNNIPPPKTSLNCTTFTTFPQGLLFPIHCISRIRTFSVYID